MLQWLAVMVLGHDGKAKRAAMDAEHAATIERVRGSRAGGKTLGLHPKQVEALAASGQVVTETQPPEPELFKVPPEAIVMPGMAPLDKTVLRVTREYAEAMGLDPDKLERA